MAEALRIAIVGAESTGKTTLAQALAEALHERTGARVALVPETLREWCEQAGRTPRAHEQAAILHAHHERIEAAAHGHEIVVCDTTGVMTAVYSRLLFGDRSLEAGAAALHAGVGATLLTALDLPWVADGHQRDGEHVREPVDTALRDLLARHALPFHVIAGTGERRLAQALAALRPALRARPDAVDQRGSVPGPRGPEGLFDALLAGDHGPQSASPLRRWRCDCCWPEGERAALVRTRTTRDV